jgi:aspartyl-tRNA(Asn)/glutamyl-tRNA(Gln) amidotransferase subunit A
VTPHWRETEWADGLERFAERLRQGETTAEATARRALDRIIEHDGRMQAFVHVAPDGALAEGRRIDGILRAGGDLGPLMGVPVAVKDLFAVGGMPTRAGTGLDVAHAIGPEGSFVARLRASGAVILGKTRTIEFAAGAQNVSRPTPWNPADRERHRSPGGSSNGSAVAVAAGYCPLAVGSDTGGSVRSPAALCGIAGHKFTAGAFDLDGVFPLCPALDSVGIFTPTPREAMLAVDTLLGIRDETRLVSLSVEGSRLGVPSPAMLSEITESVRASFDDALDRLRSAGAEIVTLDWPGADEIDTIARIFSGLVPSDLIRTLGESVLDTEADRIDPVALHRLSAARRLNPVERAALTDDATALIRNTAERMEDLDAIIYPTAPLQAPLLEHVSSTDAAVAFTRRVLGLTRVANALGMAACSVPLSRPRGGLPIGMDVAVPGGSDRACLGQAVAIHRAVAMPL